MDLLAGFPFQLIENTGVM
jgi:hypothetical protein